MKSSAHPVVISIQHDRIRVEISTDDGRTWKWCLYEGTRRMHTGRITGPLSAVLFDLETRVILDPQALVLLHALVKRLDSNKKEGRAR